jgi:3-hydroxyisobutyrate dehydrogenase-like beta-hydroxyacid dehydrogenase
MGSAMARRLLDCSIAVTAWDRDADQVRNLESRGATPATGPRDVVSDPTVVITMFPNADAVLDVSARNARPSAAMSTSAVGDRGQ